MNVKKPKIFEDMDDAQFEQLPPQYALMEEGEPMGVAVAVCDAHGGGTYVCEPFHRPISKLHAHPRREEPAHEC